MIWLVSYREIRSPGSGFRCSYPVEIRNLKGEKEVSVLSFESPDLTWLTSTWRPDTHPRVGVSDNMFDSLPLSAFNFNHLLFCPGAGLESFGPQPSIAAVCSVPCCVPRFGQHSARFACCLLFYSTEKWKSLRSWRINSFGAFDGAPAQCCLL